MIERYGRKCEIYPVKSRGAVGIVRDHCISITRCQINQVTMVIWVSGPPAATAWLTQPKDELWDKNFRNSLNQKLSDTVLTGTNVEVIKRNLEKYLQVRDLKYFKDTFFIEVVDEGVLYTAHLISL